MLKIYPFIIETLRCCTPLVKQIIRVDPDLGRQLRRALRSIALNTAEAIGVSGGNERIRFRTALGSTQEVRACLDVAETFEYVETVDARLRDRLASSGLKPRAPRILSSLRFAPRASRIAATLYRLSR